MKINTKAYPFFDRMKFIVQLYSQRRQVVTFFSLIILIILFFLFSPFAKTFVFPSLFNKKLSSFIYKTNTERIINVQSFWKLREFASPGNFVFQRERIGEQSTQNYLHQMSLSLATENLYPFALFTSKNWQSIEFLTTETDFSFFTHTLKNECETMLYKSKNEMICTRADQTKLIAFLKSQEEMAKVDPFFDVKGRDGKIVRGKSWFSVSVVKN